MVEKIAKIILLYLCYFFLNNHLFKLALGAYFVVQKLRIVALNARHIMRTARE